MNSIHNNSNRISTSAHTAQSGVVTPDNLIHFPPQPGIDTNLIKQDAFSLSTGTAIQTYIANLPEDSPLKAVLSKFPTKAIEAHLQQLTPANATEPLTLDTLVAQLTTLDHYQQQNIAKELWRNTQTENSTPLIEEALNVIKKNSGFTPQKSPEAKGALTFAHNIVLSAITPEQSTFWNLPSAEQTTKHFVQLFNYPRFEQILHGVIKL
jgi:hypothetical protein